MDNRVLERMIIGILLLVDLFLLGVVLTDRAETRRSREETAAYVTELLRSAGIAAETDAVAVQSAPPRCTLTRSSEQEQKLVQGMLGKTGREDLGGNIIFYRSDRGQTVIRGSGEIQTLFSRGALRMRGGPEKTCARLLRRMKLPAEALSAGTGEGGDAYAEFLCCRGDFPVFNAVLHFDFSGDSIYMLSGTRIFDSLTESDSSGLMDSVSALMRFAELCRSGEWSCTRLNAVRPGYLLSVLVSGESVLSPVWQLETDGGTLLLNAENGRIESGNA